MYNFAAEHIRAFPAPLGAPSGGNARAARRKRARLSGLRRIWRSLRALAIQGQEIEPLLSRIHERWIQSL